jgi:antitoxin component YwqK of YwqJK toxin-antitoxin module
MEDNNKTGRHVTYFNNGQIESERHYENGEEHGVSTEWYRNGNKEKEANYLNGFPHGKFTYWDEEGGLDRVWEYKEGIQSGTWYSYFYDGSTESEETFDDDSNSVETTWDSSGNKEAEIHKQHGHPHGISIRWHSNGNKESENNYKNGNLDGDCSSWGIDGNILQDNYYENGELIGGTSWQADGTIKSDQPYQLFCKACNITIEHKKIDNKTLCSKCGKSPKSIEDSINHKKKKRESHQEIIATIIGFIILGVIVYFVFNYLF